jgi:hypothetical protein
MFDTIIGIDNGVSGTIGVIDVNEGNSQFLSMPTKSEQNYTKAKGNITRIDHDKLEEFLMQFKGKNVFILLERPMVNPGRFAATISAIRALESTLIIIEKLQFSYIYVDSKSWQKELLPIGSKGSQLKDDSATIGKRLFPKHSDLIMKHADADGILIAEFGRRKYNQ